MSIMGRKRKIMKMHVERNDIFTVGKIVEVKGRRFRVKSKGSDGQGPWIKVKERKT